MLLKRLLLVGFFTVGLGFQNCITNCHCPPVQGLYFNIEGMDLNHFDNNRNSISANETVQFENYGGVNINFKVQYHSSNYKNSQGGFSFVTCAYACSCADNGQNGSKTERLKDITVISLNGFDADHRANDTINDLIEVLDVNLNTYLSQNQSLIEYMSIPLTLKKAPVLNKEFKVRLILELANGEIYEAESVPVNILN